MFTDCAEDFTPKALLLLHRLQWVCASARLCILLLTSPNNSMWTEGINSLPHGVVGRSQQKDAQPSAGTNPLQAVEE